jgi:molecular chaperone GrpE
LSAEFDNYRRRTLKEKMELTKTAGEDIMLKILPVVDDFERAMVSMKEAKDCEAVLDGVTLIYNKFKDFLNLQGVKEIEAVNKEFDTDLHEALTKIPAPKKKLKGKVVDVVEKGYKLNDKVIRFSKVVVGE